MGSNSKSKTNNAKIRKESAVKPASPTVDKQTLTSSEEEENFRGAGVSIITLWWNFTKNIL